MLDKIRNSIAAGRSAVGSWLAIGDPLCIETMGKIGYDFVILDAQHGGITWENMLPALQVLNIEGNNALVRVTWNDPAQIMRAMDLGAFGVVVPMVSNAEQARLAAQSFRYPPQGFRSFGRVRSYYSDAAAAPEPLCFVMIETAEGLENLQEIAATPGIDGLFVGPVDLALSLGLGPALVMPDQVLAAIDKVVAACRQHNIISGCAALGLPNAKLLSERGVQLLAIGNDLGYIRRGAAADLAATKEWPPTGR